MAPRTTPRRDPISWLLREAYLDVRDVVGRPLGEANAPSGYGEAGVQEAICAYPDRRALFEAPMNVSALRQVTTAWPALLLAMTSARFALAGRRGPTLGEAWRAATLLKSLPLGEALAGHAVSETRAGCYKAGLGYAKVYWIAALVETPTRPAADVLPLDRFFQFLDEGDWLVGAKQVCAGTRRMIEQGHERLIAGEALEAPAPPPLADSDARFGAAFTRLEGLAALSFALVRERARQNRVGDIPGFGRPSPEVIAQWPGCVSLHQAATSVVLTALRGVPGVGPDDVLDVLRAAGLASPRLDLLSSREDASLYELDGVLAGELDSFAEDLSPDGALDDPSPRWARACASLVDERSWAAR